MHRTCHIKSLETASFDAEHFLRITLVHEPAATFGAEIAIQLASGERLAAVDANGTFMRGVDGEGWESGGNTEGGR